MEAGIYSEPRKETKYLLRKSMTVSDPWETIMGKAMAVMRPMVIS
jgi:hypothetical protein